MAASSAPARRPATDASAAQWIVDSLHGFGEDVGSIVPPGFDAYCRIFHPAEVRAPDGWRTVSWYEVTQATGTTAHREMQFPNIAGRWPGEWGGDPDLSGPEAGSLPPDILEVLLPILGSHTGAPSDCFFAVWEGWAGAAASRSAPTFEVPGRRLHLWRGELAAAGLPFSDSGQSANLWWPADRLWCVATEIDFEWTYVGGSERCIAEILELSRLEAMGVEITDGITWASDTINPLPSGGPVG